MGNYPILRHKCWSCSLETLFCCVCLHDGMVVMRLRMAVSKVWGVGEGLIAGWNAGFFCETVVRQGLGALPPSSPSRAITSLCRISTIKGVIARRKAACGVQEIDSQIVEPMLRYKICEDILPEMFVISIRPTYHCIGDKPNNRQNCMKTTKIVILTLLLAYFVAGALVSCASLADCPHAYGTSKQGSDRHSYNSPSARR